MFEIRNARFFEVFIILRFFFSTDTIVLEIQALFNKDLRHILH